MSKKNNSSQSPLLLISPRNSSESSKKLNKRERIALEVAKAVGAGKPVALETVDFNDPNRPKTCLEVDFPILSVNQVATIEAASGAAKKPIYQMSKYWARRQSSVFRSILIAGATKVPEDKSHAAKLVWQNHYANHQKKGAFKNIKVADIFMGGGTTLVEGSRLGMQMIGNDLNPIAWFVVKQELADVNLEDVKRLLEEIEAEVKPQIMPYYYCDGPEGEKGNWTHLPTGKIMPPEFDPLSIPREDRKLYKYEGPEIIYTFWSKHGPCAVTGCGHRTPIMTSPVMAVKEISIKFWEANCKACGSGFHIEIDSARMAPDSPLYVAPTEFPFVTLNIANTINCPHCREEHSTTIHPKKGLFIQGARDSKNLGKAKSKKIELSLLVHPQWLAGSPKCDSEGNLLGGSAQDDVEPTTRWDSERASRIRLLEVRGTLPEQVTCPETNITFAPEKGTVPKKSHYTCAACGTVQDVLTTIKATGKTGPMAGYAIQGYAPKRDEAGKPYDGRFFAAYTTFYANQYDAAFAEWAERKESDLKDYWPRSELPYGFMTHHSQGGVPNHGLTHWWTMFNPRQLLVLAQLLKAIVEVGNYDWKVREFVLCSFQQYLRCNTILSIWHMKNNQISAALSNNNFHPKSTSLEPSVFNLKGDGNWKSSIGGLIDSLKWKADPWELVSAAGLSRENMELSKSFSGKSEKVFPGDRLQPTQIFCGSSTDLTQIETGSLDLVITDPPFGGLLHYSELADFFYVWLRLVLKKKYPKYFGPEYTPKSLEAVANRAREPEDANGFYQRLLTECWREAYRLLKPGGILAFTFHHSEDEPWVAVLESLFDAGFYLEATYPIRSDESKGDGEFGSKTIEYDIIHVCRKRTEEPKPVSWGRMRREVLADVRQLQSMLENHAKEGLPAADIQVIRRGKALEYFSRHYGKVYYLEEGNAMKVKEALIGINQLLDEDSTRSQDYPPLNAELMTRQFLKIFGQSDEIHRDQFGKFLRGTGASPDDFVSRGWCEEENKYYKIVNLLEFAKDWQGRHKRKLINDLDQAFVLIGACFENSGMNASETLTNENFKPHISLKDILEWYSQKSADSKIRRAATTALQIYNAWARAHKSEIEQLDLFYKGD